ncbi:hypothetical protein [uncultured Xanthomonas sp.]|uniref:hypothetical protein n=1 Tax=uncultured Xanthomonas sp. TaxID=152831 RepID=UPI0025E0D7CE|nr:hypothetical protein [uncultured Xanthomonas sp.]
MSVSVGTRVLRLALALALALHSASGWAVLPATLVYWVLVVLVAAAIDRAMARRTAGSTAAASLGPAIGEAGVTPAPARLPPPAQPVIPPAAMRARPSGPRQWRRHLEDIVPFPEERFPRQGICTASELVLSAGDALVLAFHPAADGPAQWRCDLLAPGATQAQWLDVAADAECVVPIVRTGVYSIGIGQAELQVPGTVALWRRVPEPERLALPVQPLRGTPLAYAQRPDGSLAVTEAPARDAWPLAQLPPRCVAHVPVAAALLFAGAERAWDVHGAPDTEVADPSDDVVVHRHFLQLSQGDVLVLEAVWTSGLFGQPLPVPGGSRPTDGELGLFALLHGSQLMALRPSAATPACVEVVCPVDGLYCLELRLFGPAAWRDRAVETFVDLRLWGAFVQCPSRLRAFSLQQVWVGDRDRQCLPVPLP